MIKKMTLPLLFAASLVCSMPAWTQVTSMQQEYVKFKTQSTGEVNFDNGQRFTYTVTSRVVKNDIEIITARIDDPLQSDLDHYKNLVVTLDNKKQQIHGFAEISDGHFRIDRTSQNGYVWRKIKTQKSLDTTHNKHHQAQR